jgi:hypothetical protein
MKRSKRWVKRQRRIERREERQARREQRIADRQANHDHDHDHHHPEPSAPDLRRNPDATLDALVTIDGNWDASFFKDRVTDGIFDVRINTATMTDATQVYVREFIEEVDEIIGTPVVVDRPNSPKPDLLIEQTFDWNTVYSSLSNYDDNNIAGLAFLHDDLVHATFKPPLQTYGELSTIDKYVIGHEILHGFGLDHPEGVGSNTAFNSHDSLMSYNLSGNSQITSLDAQALSSIWG